MELMAKEKKKKTEAEALKKKQQEEATRLLRQEKEEKELESVEAKKRQEKDLAAKANILQNLEGAIAEDERRASEEEEEAKQQEETQRKLEEDKARIVNSEDYQRSFREFKAAKANLEGDIAEDERKAKEEEEKAKQQEETKRKSEEDIERRKNSDDYQRSVRARIGGSPMRVGNKPVTDVSDDLHILEMHVDLGPMPANANETPDPISENLEQAQAAMSKTTNFFNHFYPQNGHNNGGAVEETTDRSQSGLNNIYVNQGGANESNSLGGSSGCTSTLTSVGINSTPMGGIPLARGINSTSSAGPTPPSYPPPSYAASIASKSTTSKGTTVLSDGSSLNPNANAFHAKGGSGISKGGAPGAPSTGGKSNKSGGSKGATLKSNMKQSREGETIRVQRSLHGSLTRKKRRK